LKKKHSKNKSDSGGSFQCQQNRSEDFRQNPGLSSSEQARARDKTRRQNSKVNSSFEYTASLSNFVEILAGVGL